MEQANKTGESIYMWRISSVLLPLPQMSIATTIHVYNGPHTTADTTKNIIVPVIMPNEDDGTVLNSSNPFER
jgi:hypothetical protein